MINGKELGSDSGGLATVVQTKEIPALQGLVGIVCKESVQMQKMLREQARALEPRFLAFQTVRYDRAEEVVGRPVGVAKGRTRLLQWTGFEPYFIVVSPSSNHKDGTVQAPGTVTQIADLGVSLLERIKAWDPKSRGEILRNLKGEEYNLHWLRVLNSINPFAQLRAKGLRSVEREGLGAYQEFREETYGRVAQLPHIDYKFEEVRPTQTVTLKLRQGRQSEPYEVPLTPKQLEGYGLMEEFGRVGHPLIRAALAVAYQDVESSAVWPTRLWQERLVLARFRSGVRPPVVSYDATKTAFQRTLRGG